MVGQKNLLSAVDALIKKNTFPRFAILSGDKGSGKKLIADMVAHKLCGTVINIGIKVDDIRDMIKSAYKLTAPCVYIIADADNMSLAAKNALLKVTEEPPNNAYFIMTLQDANRTLDTIRSRGTVFYMEPYTLLEIAEFIKTNIGCDEISRTFVVSMDLCETPGDVITLNSYDIKEFYDYVELVVDNIATVSGANSFKIGDKINLKKDDTKYDLTLFLRAFTTICSNRAGDEMIAGNKSEMQMFLNWVKITYKYLRELGINGINKLATFDCWILEIREASFDSSGS